MTVAKVVTKDVPLYLDEIGTCAAYETVLVQAQINGAQLRVTGKQRDDLQAAMALLRKAELDRPLQFKNFRD